MLKQGFAELMHEKDFKDITVRDITDRMDLNRGTFYLHYTDTYDLLSSIEADTLNDVQAMIDAGRIKGVSSSLKSVFEPILDYIVENREIFYSLFVGNASSNFVDKMHQLIYENGEDYIHKRFSEIPENKIEYFLSFVTYGVIGLLKYWFDSNMALSKNELLEFADKLLLNSVIGISK